MKKIKAEMDLFAETEKLNNNISDAVDTINSIFQKHGIKNKISGADIEFSNSFLWDKQYSVWNEELDSTLYLRKRKLSDIIFNHYYKKPENTTFYHFTSYNNFISIVKNKELWLFNLIKRFNEGEFRLFYSDHGFTGYETNTDHEGTIMSKSLMSQTYYISFARASTIPLEEEENLWYSFGDGGLGVRLEFEITPNYPDFRNIFYKQEGLAGNQLLINELSNEIKRKYNRIFSIAGLSKIGGFYLQGDFDTEHETRLLIKEFTDDYKFYFTPILFSGDVKYIKLKFDNPYVNIRLKSVQPGFHINDNRVEIVLDLYPFNEKPMIKPKANF